MVLRKLLKRADHRAVAEKIYAAIVAQGRHPVFYSDLGVPDTVNGRFEMIVLHAFLLFHRLQDDGERSKDLAQSIFDTMFADMDQSLREMGVGDVSVGKKIETLVSAFYGRTEAYAEGLTRHSSEPGVLRDAVKRNIYADVVIDDGKVSALSDYVAECSQSLAVQSVDQIHTAMVKFTDPSRHRLKER